MRKTTIVILALFVIGALAAPAVAANRNDFKIIQAAVKKSPNPEYVEGREVRWFKVLIQDSKSGHAALKLTLPVALIELILSCDDTRHVKFDDGKHGQLRGRPQGPLDGAEEGRPHGPRPDRGRRGRHQGLAGIASGRPAHKHSEYSLRRPLAGPASQLASYPGRRGAESSQRTCRIGAERSKPRFCGIS